MNSKILIITNYGYGGIYALLKIFTKFLAKKKIKFDIACYAPFRIFKNLSFSLFGLNKPKIKEIEFGDFKYLCAGTKFPEFEQNTYSGKVLEELIKKYDLVINISGTVLYGYLAYKNNIKLIHWVASSVYDDRRARIIQSSYLRKIFDKIFVQKKILKNEEEILNYKNQKIFTISEYSKNSLQKISNSSEVKILNYAVDTKIFYPLKKRSINKKNFSIGFAGRLDDPRKNISFLISLFDNLKKTYPGVKLKLLGDRQNKFKNISGIETNAFFDDFKKLNKFYNDVDLFIIPSHQEGLCITGLEAMATGSVVLSTNCLGPKDFVINNKTGFYLEKKLNQFQDKINLLLNDHYLYKNYSHNSIELVKQKYSMTNFESQIKNVLNV